MSKFVHLHVHSHYSLLNALPKIDEIIDRAVKYNMPAIALTDNGNLYGAIEFYKTCLKKKIKPIIGIDAYMALRGRKDKQAGVDNKRHRLVLLAKNDAGYKNLIKLTTLAHMEGFYYKPRMDKEILETHRDGLICIAPSFSSDITQAIKAHDLTKAYELVKWYKNIFGEDFYIEITHHPEIGGHENLMKELLQVARKENVSIVAAHDTYYLDPEDRKARETLLLVNTSGADSAEKNFGDESEEDFSFISQEKADELFKDLPDALENTIKIAEKCNLTIELGKWFFPNFILTNGLSYDEELRRLVYEGIPRRKIEVTNEVKKRIEYELEVIKNKGYAGYFLVVGDLLRHAHENHILTTIRGSVAGSIVTYLIGITNVDPIAYKLPFERFLNPERPSAPDIDMDYADNRRDEIIAYAKEKYGADKVAQIGTFGTMMARGAVRDTARAMGYPVAFADQIAKMIPMGAQGFPMTIERALKENPELKKLYEENADAKRIIDMAQKIEGCARHISVHAAGVVIAPRPLTDFVPLQFDPKGEEKIITQYDMHAVGEDGVGLLK
ncbi:MAG: DNA polymerase III subunit alpha, partial [Candidatus Paceibacterota bacterium]